MIEKTETSIETIIQQHKDAFDYHKPPKDLWSKIEAELPQEKTQTKKVKVFRLLTWASTAAACLFIGVFAFKSFSKEKALDPQILVTQEFYNQEFNVVYKELKKNNLINQNLMDELSALEQIEAELQEEVLTSYKDSKQDMMEKLINTYKMKLELLQKIRSKSQLKNSQDGKYLEI